MSGIFAFYYYKNGMDNLFNRFLEPKKNVGFWEKK